MWAQNNGPVIVNTALYNLGIIIFITPINDYERGVKITERTR